MSLKTESNFISSPETPTRGKAVFSQNGKIQVKIPDTARDFVVRSEIQNYGATADSRTLYYGFSDKTNYSQPIIHYATMEFRKQWLPKSFVIEGLLYGSGANCNQTDFSNVKPFKCFGDIKLRHLSKDD